MRSQREIDEQLNLAVDQTMEGSSKWPGMTYEDGVENALRWVTGETDEAPMEDS